AWLQPLLSLYLLSHASVVIVAPTRNILYQLRALLDVSSDIAYAPSAASNNPSNKQFALYTPQAIPFVVMWSNTRCFSVSGTRPNTKGYRLACKDAWSVPIPSV